MKTIIGKVVLSISMAIAAIFTPVAKAGTLNVFAEYIGTTAHSSPNADQQAAYAAFLENNDIDFGVFYGPSSSGNFGFSHADYSKSSGSSAGGTGGFHIFVYKKARWTLLKRYDMQTASNKKNKELKKAEIFLKALAYDVDTIEVKHWDNRKWGETPADFGNK